MLDFEGKCRHDGRHERAAEWREAIAEVERGRTVVQAPGGAEYRVVDSAPESLSERRYNAAEGSRSEILAELDAYVDDRAQQGRPQRAAEHAAAAERIRDGETETRVGFSLLRVTED
jgi:hypothetical protein